RARPPPRARWAAPPSLARGSLADPGPPPGAPGAPQPPLAPAPKIAADGEIAVAVAGAHLSGMPLNSELKSFGARFLEETTTTADYRLFALAGATPPKPGLLRVDSGRGAAIAIEIWALPEAEFGRLGAAVPSPLTIGTLSLADGRRVKGFLVEAEATHGARDISVFGGWRAFMAQAKASA